MLSKRFLPRSPTSGKGASQRVSHRKSKTHLTIILGGCMNKLVTALTLAAVSTGVLAEDRVLLWGDTHLHTTFSSDAFANGNLTSTPDVAYRFAKGMPVEHPYNGMRVQLRTPLDFLVVSDHAEFMGVIRNTYREGVDVQDVGLIDTAKARIAEWILQDAVDEGTARKLFVDILPEASDDPREAAATWVAQVGWIPEQPRVEANAWQVITDTADAHNKPGTFTALIGWEYSSIPAGANLHRVVVSDLDASRAQSFVPFGLDQSPYPEALWPWLEETAAATEGNFLAIPHNSNISKGFMFDTTALNGEPMTAEMAQTRRYWEPIVEITQIKGDSETHPALSPNDPFADFESYAFYIQRSAGKYEAKAGDYIRSAMRRGLEMEADIGVNPYQFGVIGSTDSHTALSSAEENNFLGKMATDSIPANKTQHWGDDARGTFGWAMSASGLAAVWAEENTRESIVEAMRRREVYATSGPRIGVRVFAGYGLSEADLSDSSFPSNVRDRAVPMGGVLASDEQSEAPVLLIEATADPDSGSLDRVQVVKGWRDDSGQSHERIFNIAWAGGQDRLLPDGELTPVANTVDLNTGFHDNSVGVGRLAAAWTDPDFDPTQASFYYVRVLQIPTARHSLYDKIALGGDVDTQRPDTIQERAYTSAVWYQP